MSRTTTPTPIPPSNPIKSGSITTPSGVVVVVVGGGVDVVGGGVVVVGVGVVAGTAPAANEPEKASVKSPGQ